MTFLELSASPWTGGIFWTFHREFLDPRIHKRNKPRKLRMPKNFAVARANMINGQIITVGVTDRRLIATLSVIPRERFVPAGMTRLAYMDADVLIKESTRTSPARYLMAAGPFARLVQEANISREDIVLDVGCATGYSSAVFAQLANSVIALESDERLAGLAAETLVDIGVDNVAVVTGPLADGWSDAGPYDVIFIGGSIDDVPTVLTDQLSFGGRLVGIIGRGHSASGTVFIKSRSAVGVRRFLNAAVPTLPGFKRPKAFVF